mgnify:CR=1 FL=1|jgi:hypothetical protein
MTTISRRFYNEGYQMTGEGRRVDILDPKKEKKVEIFFYEKGILILTKERYIWTKNISEIDILKGLPCIKTLG